MRPAAIFVAVLAYDLALLARSRRFRRRYGAEMRETFAALAGDAAARGMLPLGALAVHEIWDLAHSEAAARLEPAPPPVFPERSMSVGPIWQDIRYAGRMLRRQPGFAIVAVLTLALGIGATTAVFTVVNGVLLRPLPYGQPDQLVTLLWGRPGRVSPWFSPRNLLDVTADSHAFAAAAAATPSTVNLTGTGDPERVDGALVSWNYFDVLEVRMREGRGFTEGDGQGDGNVVVISSGIAERLFGGRNAVGSTLKLDGRPCTVVGVAPADMRLPANAEFWQPLIFSPRNLAQTARGAQWVTGIARLAPGVDLQRADTAVQTVAKRLATAYPKYNKDRIATVVPLKERMVHNVRATLLVLLGAVAFVLLIACVNVASLLLARAQARGREVAVRSALGAGRGRLIRQFLAESLVLGAAGASGGLLVAYWCLQALVALAPAGIPRLAEVTIDLRVLAFTMALGIATSVLFGLAPAIASTGGVLARLIGAGRGSVGGGSRLRKALVVCEMALAVVLLVGAGLLLRSYAELQRVRPGFDPGHVITFNVSLPAAKYPTNDGIARTVASLVDRINGEPGVERAAAVFGLPFVDDFSAGTSFTKPGQADDANAPSAGMRVVTPGYFETMKIPLKAGRLFDAHDDENGPEVVLINEAAAARFWPGENPIGQTLHVGVWLTRGKPRSGMKTIVGIVGNVKYEGLDSGTPPEIYLPHAQHPVDGVTIVARTRGEPMALAPVLRADLASVDRELPMANVRPMTALIGSSIAERRFTMLLLVAFAAVAALLAAIGIYGVLAYVVGQRTQEIGVRLAIGASPGSVVALFLREGLWLAAVGLVFGLAGALATTRAIASMLFGVTAADPVTFVFVGVGLAAVALLASYLPARRAARVDPCAALRAE
jgi:putative ABC transport system permease protein